MKLILSFVFLLLVGSCSSFREWESTGVFKGPESAFYDKESGYIFVSNVNGMPHEKNNAGFISKLSLAGEMIDSKWVRGLNAPKGLRSHKGYLWVADINKVVKIDIKTGKKVKIFWVDGAKMLNDVFVIDNEHVYVSDTLRSRIYFIDGKKADVFMKGKKLESPNGLFAKDDFLYVAAWGYATGYDWKAKTPGNLYKINLKTKEKTLITKEPLGNLDGLEMDKNGNFIVSDWSAGKVYRVSPEGESELVFENGQNIADLSLNDEQTEAILPIMNQGKVHNIEL